MVSSKKTSLKGLQAGRPPMSKSSRTMSRKASRTLINTHHQLHKRRKQAVAKGDKFELAFIDKELEELGGLDHYQQASLQGQSQDRGGDTSKLLLEWLPTSSLRALDTRPRLLEVGSLSTKNACSTSGLFDTVHIDLNSQEVGIEQQDFMERPLPNDDSERFDIISLSLVLNYVPDAAGRGQMLKRTLTFLKHSEVACTNSTQPYFPSLFMVLPRSCLDNSRYMTATKFGEIMEALGYVKVHEKMTQKLAYSLWRKEKMIPSVPRAGFTKKEINPGRTRNNFSITLGNCIGR